MSDSFATPSTIAHQAPLSMEFPRQEYWRGLRFPSAVDLPDPGMEPESPVLADGFFTMESPGKTKITSFLADFILTQYALEIQLHIK